MLADILLVAEKELKEVLLRQGGAKANVFNWGLILLVFGVVIPVRAGADWIHYPSFVLTWVWLPLLLVSALVADSFAGERERHTLETLLTSRLSDRAILFGKVAAAIGYAYSMLLVLMVTSLISVNVAPNAAKMARYGLTFPMLWPPRVVLEILGFGLLGITLIATIGVTVSLKSETVRQASQRLSLGLIAVFMLPLMAIGAVTDMLSQPTRDALIEWLAQLDGRTVGIFIALVLVVLDAFFIALAVRWFRRSRLVFD